MTAPLPPDPRLSRENGLVRNAWLIARREFRERVRSRLFFVSTGLLAALAIVVSLTPVLIRAVDRGSTTTIAVASPEPGLTTVSIGILDSILNPGAKAGVADAFEFVAKSMDDNLAAEVSEGRYAGALIATRGSNGGLSFQLLAGESLGTDRVQMMNVGALMIGVLDWIGDNPGRGSAGQFFTPGFESSQVSAGSGGGSGIVAASEYAGRRIVGVVFVVLIFITLVIYGMWVAAGVVAEKSSRVMELLISAATPEELVIGKVVGIGLAGLVQYVAILVPALLTLVLQDRIAEALLGSSAGLQVSLSALTPGLLAAYGGFWILAYILYALIYAAAGSLVSRAEDLQVLALPLSIVAIGGYLQAVMALSGGINEMIRVASYVPFWSPFVMLTRLTVARVELWELVLSYGLLIAAIPIVGIIAVRVYSAGVLLYGQRPGTKEIVGAILRPPA